jgi:hypothetical protein
MGLRPRWFLCVTMWWWAWRRSASGGHEEPTNADRQRRITESFSRAVKQLGSDKPEVRLGGIHSLERSQVRGVLDAVCHRSV